MKILKKKDASNMDQQQAKGHEARTKNHSRAKNIIHYWRNSLADQETIQNSERQPKEIVHLSFDEIKKGYIPEKNATHFFTEAEKRLNAQKKSPKKKTVEKITLNLLKIVIVPYTFRDCFEHGRSVHHSKQKNRALHPLYIVATLTRNGEIITTNPPTHPWIDRRYLTPIESSNKFIDNPLIGDVNDIDTFYLQNDINQQTTFEQLFEYGNNLFQELLSKKKNSFNYRTFKLLEEGYVAPINSQMGFTRSIRTTYDQYLATKHTKLPSILQKLLTLEAPKYKENLNDEQLLIASQHHLAQMQNKYPLSASQRQSLCYFFKEDQNQIFTINGPPGTGKTSLIQSIISSKWVESALKKQSLPPLIVAASSNNHAVTNILDNFSQAQENTSSLLESRWLPNFSSYGLHLARQKQDETEGSNKSNHAHPYRILKGSFSSLDHMYKETYYKEALEHYKNKFNIYFSTNMEELKECKNHIHQIMEEKQKQLKKAIEFSNHACKIMTKIKSIHGSHEALSKSINHLKIKKTIESEKLKAQKSIEIKWIEYKSKSLFLFRFFTWIPIIKSILNERIKLFTLQYSDFFQEDFLSIDEVDRHIHAEKSNCKSNGASLSGEIKELEKIDKKIKNILNRKLDLEEEINIQFSLKNIYEFNNPQGLLQQLDLTIRHDLFHLATHYWEACWLLENRQFEKLKSYDRKTREKFWKIQSMISPCFVTTLHSGPGFFAHKDKSDEFETLSDFIDLLIIDEAGQVTPAIAGALISVAKNALFIGDTKQIEPIFTLPTAIDLANAKKHAVCKDNHDYDALKIKGILCSGDPANSHSYGNLVLLGQSCSKYKLKENKEPGMMLKEHRRCQREIISFCNELCYNGQLIPLTQEKTNCFPKMGYAHIRGIEKKIGTSRKNKQEAQVIAAWLQKNKAIILKQYQKETLSDCVGIITPFASQALCIRHSLNDCNISLDKVGTVHALQGAEKPIIIFSPAYASSSTSTKLFFDKSPNILNVAVSRAQHSFLVFGDMSLFDPKKSTPSGTLAKYLFSDTMNEITDIIQPSYIDQNHEEVIHITDLHGHQNALKQSFMQAKESLYIVSPYLAVKAIKNDDIPSLIKNCCKRSISVHIYTMPCNHGEKKIPFENACQILKDAGANVYLVNNVHSKIIAIDNRAIIEGSFNWLSSARCEQYSMQECSIIYQGDQAASFINEALTPIQKKIKNKYHTNDNDRAKVRRIRDHTDIIETV